MCGLYVVDKEGKRRKAVECLCESCSKKFLIAEKDRKKGRGRFCSIECRRTYRKVVVLTCAGCGEEFERKPSSLKCSKSGIYFCCRECKDQAQRIGGIAEIMPPHYGTSGGRHAWRTLIERSEAPQCCGCSTTKRYLLRVHHVDGDTTNNKPENHEVVCGNCHIERHLRQVDDVWVYDPRCLTPRECLGKLDGPVV